VPNGTANILARELGKKLSNGETRESTRLNNKPTDGYRVRLAIETDGVQILHLQPGARRCEHTQMGSIGLAKWSELL
jgi:hypothetical protein